MLQACLNGARTKREHPAIPVTLEELAGDAVTARSAGADELHIHPRDAGGAESLRPEDVGPCLSAVRAAVPGMPVGVSTGAWIEPMGAARLRHVENWTVLPSYASVNLNEDDAPEAMAILASKDIAIEAGLSTVKDAERFVALKDKPACLRILIELASGDPDMAEREYAGIRRVLDASEVDRPLLVHGTDGSVWRMVDIAKRDRIDTRVGFEDGLTLPDGERAASNADIVKAACRILA